MPKKEQIKKIIPVNELGSSQFTDVVELERTVTPNSDKRVDHIFVRRKKICKANPAEIFATEEYARFDIAWPEETKKEVKEDITQDATLEINN